MKEQDDKRRGGGGKRKNAADGDDDDTEQAVGVRKRMQGGKNKNQGRHDMKGKKKFRK